MQNPYVWNGIPSPATEDWSQWMQRLYQTELRLQQLTEKMQEVQKQLDEVKSKPPLHVEYHFDQLKVNRLEGTLNVGMSPPGMPGIESFETPDPACWKPDAGPVDESETQLRGLQREMNAFMDQEAADALVSLERQYGIPLDEEHRRKVLQDVKNQINERVRYYAKTAPYPAQGTEEERQKWAASVKDKTKRDIQAAFSAYLYKLKGQTSKGASPQ